MSDKLKSLFLTLEIPKDSLASYVLSSWSARPAVAVCGCTDLLPELAAEA